MILVCADSASHGAVLAAQRLVVVVPATGAGEVLEDFILLRMPKPLAVEGLLP